MNILIYACADFPEGPATTSRIKLLSKILIESGHKISLAIFNANTKQPIAENQCNKGIYDSIEYTYLNGKTYRPSEFLGALNDTLKGIVNSTFYLSEKIKQGHVDAVLFYTPDIFRVLPCLVQTKINGIPILLELCEMFSVDTRKSGVTFMIKRMAARISDKILPIISSGIIVISKRISEHLKLTGIEEAKIIGLPILVDCDRFTQHSLASVPLLLGKLYFLNSGALDEKEGLEFILEAFAQVARNHDQTFLAFTGTPNDQRKRYIVDYAKRLKIEQKLIFTGFVSIDQLSWAYQNAIALLCCRTNTLFANYGFPTKLGEYLSSGKPVITTNVGDIHLYLKDRQSAFIALSENSESIMKSMEAILSDPILATRVGREGQKVAKEQFYYGNYVQPLDNFICTIIDRSTKQINS